MKKNQLKEKLAAGRPVYGAMVQFPDADLVEMLGYAGFDWILIDAEHGSINENDCAGMVRACELADTTAIVRPPSNHPEVIMRFLDRGAQGAEIGVPAPLHAALHELVRKVEHGKIKPTAAHVANL